MSGSRIRGSGRPVRLATVGALLVSSISLAAAATGAASTSVAETSALTPRWVAVAPMAGGPRDHMAAASAASGIYAIGGDRVRFGCALSCNVTALVERYDPATNTWTAVRSMNERRDFLAATAGVDGRVYAIGGYSATCGCITDTVEVYDPATDRWRYTAPMPASRWAPSAAAGADGRIYVLGGESINEGSTDVFVYTPATDSWAMGPPKLTPNVLGGAATGADGRIYSLPDGDVFDPRTGLWAHIAPMPAQRGYLAAASDAAGRIYAVGGYLTEGGTTRVDVYDPATNRWRVAPRMRLGRSTLGAARGGDGRIYAVGGNHETGPWVTTGRAEALDVEPPTRPAGLTADLSGADEVRLSWSPSTDRVGVTGYLVFRNGRWIATVTGTEHVDSGLAPQTVYAYSVRARDLAGNVSARSNTATVVTP
jgi:N-acetylneuraminic acid mutarotase